MEFEQIKQYLEQNKDNEEVKSYIEGLSEVTPDKVEAYLEAEDGKKLIQPKLDSYFNKGLETWKKNNLKKLIDDEVKKRNPDETEEQKRIRELEEYVAQKEKEAARQTYKNKALTVLNEKKLPSNLVDFFIGEDEESTLSNLEQFEEVFTTRLQEAVESKLKAGGTDLKGGSKPTTFTRDQINSMSQAEINENWEAIQESLKSN